MEQQNVTPEDLAAQPLDGIGNNAKTEDFRMKNKVYEIFRSMSGQPWPMKSGSQCIPFYAW